MPQGPTTGTDGKRVVSCSHQDRRTGEHHPVLTTSSPSCFQATPHPPSSENRAAAPLLPGPVSGALVPGFTFLIGAFWGWGGASQWGQRAPGTLPPSFALCPLVNEPPPSPLWTGSFHSPVFSLLPVLLGTALLPPHGRGLSSSSQPAASLPDETVNRHRVPASWLEWVGATLPELPQHRWLGVGRTMVTVPDQVSGRSSGLVPSRGDNLGEESGLCRGWIRDETTR